MQEHPLNLWGIQLEGLQLWSKRLPTKLETKVLQSSWLVASWVAESLFIFISVSLWASFVWEHLDHGYRYLYQECPKKGLCQMPLLWTATSSRGAWHLEGPPSISCVSQLRSTIIFFWWWIEFTSLGVSIAGWTPLKAPWAQIRELVDRGHLLADKNPKQPFTNITI